MQAAVEREWDRVWVGVSIATMVAGADAYGKSGADALAVKDGRIAWLGPAAEARHRAAAHHIPVEECAGLWMTPGLIELTVTPVPASVSDRPTVMLLSAAFAAA